VPPKVDALAIVVVAMLRIAGRSERDWQIWSHMRSVRKRCTGFTAIFATVVHRGGALDQLGATSVTPARLAPYREYRQTVIWLSLRIPQCPVDVTALLVCGIQMD
jgi:hypothetical protein